MEVPLTRSLLQCRRMEDEEGYTVLNLRPKGGALASPASASIQGPPQNPCWHRWGQWATCVMIIILVVTVTALGIWVSQLVSEKGQTLAPDSNRVWSGDISTANCHTCLEHFRSQLTQRLCHAAQPSPAGHSRCKLCPTDWRLCGDKCYWVSTEHKMWNESHTDCSARGSRLMVIQDREDLESLKTLTQGTTNQFWLGLSVPSPEKGWAWLDGSRLDQTPFSGLDQAEGSNCGVMKGNQIRSDSCSSVFQWICQQDAIPL